MYIFSTTNWTPFTPVVLWWQLKAQIWISQNQSTENQNYLRGLIALGMEWKWTCVPLMLKTSLYWIIFSVKSQTSRLTAYKHTHWHLSLSPSPLTRGKCAQISKSQGVLFIMLVITKLLLSWLMKVSLYPPFMLSSQPVYRWLVTECTYFTLQTLTYILWGSS